MKKIKLFLVPVLLLLLVLNVNTISASAATYTFSKTLSISMVENFVTLETGATKTLKVKTRNVDIKTVKWKSSNSSIVSVNTKGQIKALKPGKANIIAYVPNTVLQANAIITVNAKPVSIKMVEPKVTLLTGATKTLKVKATNVDMKKVKWKSSNATIVSVDSKGQIKAIKNGNANITAYVPNTKLQTIAVITVNKKPLKADEAFKKVNPSVVFIESYNKHNEKVASGSGVIASKDGVIITNHHVIVDVSEISFVKVRLANGQVYETDQVIGYDPTRDLAVLKINGPTNLVPIEMGDSNKIKTGEKIYALGSPLGSQNSITEGIISNELITEDKMSYIQFTAPISQGNSGGALVNVYGELIGINVAYFIDGQNMNLAIPVQDFKTLNKTKSKTIKEVNQEFYIPVKGTGDSNESEYNDELDYANEITFADGAIDGELSNSKDMDLFYFLVTDYSLVTIFGTSEDPTLSEDLGFSLYDLEGNTVLDGEIVFDEELNRYICGIIGILEPGYYHLGVYALNGTTLPYNSSDYKLFYSIVDSKSQDQ